MPEAEPAQGANLGVVAYSEVQRAMTRGAQGSTLSQRL
jgi:hypothetical protein